MRIKSLLPFIYIAVLCIIFFYFVGTGDNSIAGRWIAGATAQMAAISFWVIAVVFGYFAVKYDAAIIALVVSLASAAMSAKPTQEYLNVIGVTADLAEIFISKLIALFTAYLVVFSLFAIVNTAINWIKKSTDSN